MSKRPRQSSNTAASSKTTTESGSQHRVRIELHEDKSITDDVIGESTRCDTINNDDANLRSKDSSQNQSVPSLSKQRHGNEADNKCENRSKIKMYIFNQI